MTIQEDNYRMGFWESCWTEEKSLWHKDQIHPILRNYEVVDITLNGSELKVFVAEPLPPTSGIPEYATRKVDAVFDRGSMVAILPKLRKDYIKFMQKWVKPGSKLLLHGPEYDTSLKEGPPFNVNDTHITKLYEGIAHHELLESVDNPSYGLDKTLFHAWLMTFN
ncbi:hypothetical protein CONCODRAFT_86367 [Conidiobolus coronatus NRRL 28638]|uniref:Uncharacterized protein n=1 Tax=Conidiobolus coronatus (strain ATCC 28846 / CBS 209.66 / NRRL 28638) TaxID=796925 RepID=A0A137P122_CONC2|nr:hypothetical protein CONCODRAFT_86367 [Conidiobolus coronatus NRRL 28638]|eukprot:KXN68658.1 hypothetical protein CONCODRAFT_86367 [Conidiobolus coronatus NRRL 28638]